MGHPSAGAGVGQKPAGGRSGHLSSGCGKSAFSLRWMGQLSAGIGASQPSVGGGVGQLRARGGRISHQLEVGPNLPSAVYELDTNRQSFGFNAYVEFPTCNSNNEICQISKT